MTNCTLWKLDGTSISKQLSYYIGLVILCYKKSVKSLQLYCLIKAFKQMIIGIYFCNYYIPYKYSNYKTCNFISYFLILSNVFSRPFEEPFCPGMRARPDVCKPRG